MFLGLPVALEKLVAAAVVGDGRTDGDGDGGGGCLTLGLLFFVVVIFPFERIAAGGC